MRHFRRLVFWFLLGCLLSPSFAGQRETLSYAQDSVPGGALSYAQGSLVRVYWEQQFAGLLHDGRLLSQSRVQEIREFSGVVLDSRGYIACYVGDMVNMDQPQDRFWIQLTSGGKYPAKLIGMDHRLSVALLRSPGAEKREVVFGASLDEKRLRCVTWLGGGWAVARLDVLRFGEDELGPEEDLKVRAFPEGKVWAQAKSPWMQCSGSVMLDRAGRLVGLVTNSDRSGFSKGIHNCRVLPVNLLRRSMEDILAEGGHVRAGWLGVFLDPDGPGVRVDKVIEASPAASAGLRSGDVIVELDRHSVPEIREFVKAVRWRGPESEITLTVQREGLRSELQARLGTSPIFRKKKYAWALQVPKQWYSSSASVNSEAVKIVPIPIVSPFELGLGVDVLSPQLAQYFNSPTGRGLLVTEVVSASPASNFGLKAGDVLIEINGAELGSVSDIKRAILSAGSGRLEIKYVRDGKVSARKLVLY